MTTHGLILNLIKALSLSTIYIREEKTAYLRAKVSSLKKKDREIFYSLYDCKQEEGTLLNKML